MAHMLASTSSWRNIPQPVYEAVDALAKALEDAKRDNAELVARLNAVERRQDRLEELLIQMDALVKKNAAEEPAVKSKDLREVLERVQVAATASARAADDEAELSRRVDALDRSRAQMSTKLLSIEKAKRQRDAKLSDAAALLRRLAAG